MHTHIHTYPHMHTHAHVYTYIHTQSYGSVLVKKAELQFGDKVSNNIHCHLPMPLKYQGHWKVFYCFSTYTHTYTHTYIHTHIHTHMHTQSVRTGTEMVWEQLYEKKRKYSSEDVLINVTCNLNYNLTSLILLGIGTCTVVPLEIIFIMCTSEVTTIGHCYYVN